MKLITTICFFLIGMIGVAQTKNDKIKEVVISTSAQCGMCKKTLETNLTYEKGVKKATLDVESKKLTIKYDSSKTDITKIKNAISKSGYEAEEVKADPKAYEKLNACCKKDGGH